MNNQIYAYTVYENSSIQQSVQGVQNVRKGLQLPPGQLYKQQALSTPGADGLSMIVCVQSGLVSGVHLIYSFD